MKLIPLFLIVALISCSKPNSKFRPTSSDNKVPVGAKGDFKVLNLQKDVNETLKGAQVSDALRWQLLDSSQGVEGISLERLYSEFQVSNARTVIVAVIDGGTDINHEDLQGQIWTNEKEIPENGIDDDQNGFVDDIHGWNFLGNKDGKNIGPETLEVTREYRAYQRRIDQGSQLSADELAYYQKVKSEVEKGLSEANEALSKINPDFKKSEANKKVLQEILGMKSFKKEELEAITSTDKEVLEAKQALLSLIETYKSLERLEGLKEYNQEQVDHYFNVNFDPRKDIIGDDDSNLDDHNYGNNDVIGDDPSHGTHVAGIISAVRNNGIGMDGVATNVKIMVLRAIPNGDERDKDIANAVRYAVDNGAQIISMSFGKSYSPHKKGVDDAFKYASSKNVLLVHASGNESSLITNTNNFPNKFALDTTLVDGWLDIGASASIKGPDLPASFSNYGKNTVELFAPGDEIYSTTPYNTYDSYSGTSMATPVVSGVAALLLSNFPTLTAKDLKKILMDSSQTYPGLMVNLPSDGSLPTLVDFANLSVTGGIVNALNAFKLAKNL